MRIVIFLLIAMIAAAPAAANDRLVRLYAPDPLVETGLFKFILPRFSLKTQVRVELTDTPADADMILGDSGRAVFQGPSATWHVTMPNETPAARRLTDWMTSEVGRRTIFGYAPDGAELFSAPAEAAVVAVAVEMDGNAIVGHAVSRRACARCHAIDDATRKTSIGSTPSFFVLRSFDDWDARFGAFYVLKPHAAFTQITDVTEPFPEDRPSPIVPIELTIDEVEAVLAYVNALPAADLGDPLKHQ